LRDYGTKTDIADTALFLSTDNAKYITGTIVDCDGGTRLGDASANALGDCSQGRRPMNAVHRTAVSDCQCPAYELRRRAATPELNRPERRNALSRRAYDELEAGFRTIAADPQVRCAIVTGADPAFCSGEDVKEMMTGEARESSIASLTRVRPEPTPAAVAALECDK